MTFTFKKLWQKSRNVIAGTGRKWEGSTSGVLLPYEMKTKCFAAIQHSQCVFFFFLLIDG